MFAEPLSFVFHCLIFIIMIWTKEKKTNKLVLKNNFKPKINYNIYPQLEERYPLPGDAFTLRSVHSVLPLVQQSTSHFVGLCITNNLPLVLLEAAYVGLAQK